MTSTTRQTIEQIEAQLANTVWKVQEAVQYAVFERVLNAFIHHKVSEEHFLSVTGYGHDDLGRDVTDAVFADALQAEAALVRLQMVSGTHALSIGLNGCLQPGDTMLSITGRPYDTLEEVIGLRGKSRQSLRAKGVDYQEFSIFDQTEDVVPVRTQFTSSEIDQLRKANLVFIQRSRGYSLRPSLTIQELEILIRQTKAINPDVIVMVDNCYG